MDCVFAQEINQIQVHICLFACHPLDLNGDSFSWLHMLKLSMLAGGQHPARAEPPSANKSQFSKERVLEESVRSLCWLRPRLSFNRLDLFQTSQLTKYVDTQGEGKWREAIIREWYSLCFLKEVWMIHQFMHSANVNRYTHVTYHYVSVSVPVGSKYRFPQSRIQKSKYIQKYVLKYVYPIVYI